MITAKMVIKLPFIFIILIQCLHSYQVNFNGIEFNSPTQKYRSESIREIDEIVQLNPTDQNVSKTNVYDRDEFVESNELFEDTKYLNENHSESTNDLDEGNKNTMTGIESELIDASTIYPNEVSNGKNKLSMDINRLLTPAVYPNHKMETTEIMKQSVRNDTNSTSQKSTDSNRTTNDLIETNITFSIPPNLDMYLPKTNHVINNTFKTDIRDKQSEEKDIIDEFNISEEIKPSGFSNYESKTVRLNNDTKPKTNLSNIIIPRNLNTLLPADTIDINKHLESEDSFEQGKPKKYYSSTVATKDNANKMKTNSRFLEQEGMKTKSTNKPYVFLGDIDSYQIVSLLQNRLPRRDRSLLSKGKNDNSFDSESALNYESKRHFGNYLKTKEHKTLFEPLNAFQNMAGTDKVMKELFESSDDKYSYNEHKTKDKRDDLYSPKVIMSDENSEQLPLKQLGEKVFGDTLNRDASKTYSSSESNASNEWKITNAFENKTDKVQTDNIENDTSKAQDDVVENITNNVATKDENNTHAIQRNVVENNKKDVLTNVEKNTNGFLTNVENNKHEVQANVVQNNTNKIQTNNFENNTNVKVKDEEIENVTESIKSIEPSTNMPIPVYSPSINYNFRYGYTNSPESQPLTTEYFTEIPGIFPTISNADIKNHRSRNAKQLLLPVNDIHSTFNYTKEQYEAIKAVNLDKIIYDLIMSKNSTKPSEEESKENSKGLDENVTVVNVSNETENFDLLESDGNETEHKSVVTVTSLPKVNTDQTNEDLKVDVIKNNTVIASNNTQSELLETGENKNDNNTFTTVIPTVKTSPTNDEFKLNLIKNIIRDKVRSRMRQYALNNSEPIVEEQLEATSIVRANSSEGQRKKRDVGENSYEDNENDIDSVNYSGEYFLDTDSVEEVNAITGRKESGNIELKEIGRIFNISDVTLHDSDLQSISDSIANGTALFFPNSTVKDKVLSCLLDFLRVVRILSTKCFNVSANGFDDNSIKCLRRTILKTMEKAVESDEIVVGYDLVLVKTNTGTPSDLDSKADRQIDSSTSWFGWYADLFRTLVRMFRTHTLKFRTEGRSFEVGTGRKGHKYRKVFPLIVAAYMVVSAFLLPMGFKFMLILGGTAIMFAKLAVALNALVLYRKSGPAHPVAYGVPVPVPYEHHQEVHDPQWAGWSQQGW